MGSKWGAEYLTDFEQRFKISGTRFQQHVEMIGEKQCLHQGNRYSKNANYPYNGDALVLLNQKILRPGTLKHKRTNRELYGTKLFLANTHMVSVQ